MELLLWSSSSRSKEIYEYNLSFLYILCSLFPQENYRQVKLDSTTVAGNFEEVVSADSHAEISLINQHLWDTIQMMAEISILNWNGF